MKPSPSELLLLKSLWREKELSARELHEMVAGELGWSASSTRKTLDRMVAKGLVSRRDLHGINVYRAKAEKVPTLAALTRDFISNVLGLKSPPPVSTFSGSNLLSEEELRELEELLARDDDA
ncbi:BlaI/MecI/CopY family transcriptional regulator [Rhizobiales bacterium]|uniref:BlaI/MecI/CopY family transcriptional regulator n=1 Tax=Hongsoonwoonella zoysiae TaxID=2821844 RepID=UPI00156167D8|nr:BlaI/MecI/CopY family transcriptional regulator [Hongsoonwoonella zoysiae]NRG17892.1 BlaI/MecI/CopY family transcriptional regulator [Hongsoonwoonella zoysiae]